MLGGQARLLGDEMPWVMPLDGGAAAIRALVTGPMPELSAGLLPRALDQLAFYRQALEGYANCRATFQLTLPDLQGPFSVAELLWGPDIYLALFDHPDLVQALLARIVDLMLVVYQRLKVHVRDDLGPGFQYQHAAGVRGQVLVRDDSAINISAKQYRQFIQPHNARLAAGLGQIGIHFCGNGMHLVDDMLAIPGLACLDIGQPEMMDLNALYEKAAANRVALARLTVPEDELRAGQIKRRFPSGVNLVYEAETVEDAHRLWQRYCQGAA
jgi:hypothetical protein